MTHQAIGDLFSLAKGRKAPEVFEEGAEGIDRYIQIEDLRSDSEMKYAKDASGTRVVSTDICIAWDGANAGTVGYGLTGLIGSTIARLRPVDVRRVFTPYVARYLQGKFEVLNQSTTGATIPHVSRDKLIGLKLALPQYDEQRRIAAILDKADGIRKKRRDVLMLADEFLRSVFLDMFGDPQTNSKGWQTLSLGDLILDGPTNGLYVPASEYGSGTPILRIDGFYDGRLVDGYAFKRVRIDSRTVDRYRLRNNSVVINRVNSREYVGKVAAIDILTEPTVFESNMMNFTVHPDQLKVPFLVEQLGQPFIRRQIAQARKDAVNQSSINQSDISALLIRVPPLALQQKFVLIFRTMEAVKAKLTRQAHEAEQLISALSSNAFSGKL